MTMIEEPLQRFVDNQTKVYPAVLSELNAGRKQSCWMWYIFPQIEGLGHSEAAQFFAIHSLDEAKSYLEHPILGKRLKECTEILLALDSGSAEAVFGYPDCLKFRSSMTLFSLASQQEGNLFQEALEKYYGGDLDQNTLKILQCT